MKVAIRVDASSQIGTGHFMRCLTLADALKQRGAQVRFVSRFLPEHLLGMLVEKGHQSIRLNSSLSEVMQYDLVHAHWLGTSQHADAQESIQALSDQIWDWLVVDHYALDARWESALHQSAKHLLVIDDIADRRHDCDLLLDQNYYADMGTRYVGKVPEHCQLLLGPRYALLRDEFRQLREQVKPRVGPVKNVLVFFGGVDADNYTGRAVEALSNLDIEGLNVDVVIGAQHPHREQIESACAENQFVFHVQTMRMAKLMTAADLSIGAGGSATWERCCLGLPTFAIGTAENQVKQVADAASEGLLYAIETKDDLTQTIKRHLGTLLENDYLRQAISRKALQAVDGRGVLRVIGYLGFNTIKIIRAAQDDLEKLYAWRNHPSIRAVSRNPEVITWADHQNWFSEMLVSTDRVLLIGQCDDEPMGVVRFDIQDGEAEVSIYVVPGIEKVGLGHDLLQAAERWLVASRPEVCTVRAHVLADNERSQRLFLGSGYQVDSTYFSKRLQ